MLETRATELEDVLEFLYACPVGLVQTSIDGAILMANPMAMKLLLPIAACGIVTNLFDVLCRYSNELRSIVSDLSASQSSICENHRIFVHAAGRNGIADPLVLACTLVKLNDHRLVATLSDVSRQVVQERRLQQAETWFATLLDNVNNFAVVSLDRHGKVDGANAAAADLTGYSQDVMLGRTLDEFDVPERGSAAYTVQEQMAIAQRDGWHLDEGWRMRADRERFWCQRLVAARSEDVVASVRVVSGYTVVLRDVTRGDSDRAKLKELLTTDHLTGACNRAHFFELAERQRLRLSLQGRPLAMIAIDIDHFKRINDEYGHAAGDLTLQAFTKLCSSMLRDNDTFARTGGEEFVVLLPAIDLATAVSTAERLRAAVAAFPVQLADDVIHITASFGCAVMTDSGETLGGVLEIADKRLYRAKQGGRNRVEPSEMVIGAPPAATVVGTVDPATHSDMIGKSGSDMLEEADMRSLVKIAPGEQTQFALPDLLRDERNGIGDGVDAAVDSAGQREIGVVAVTDRMNLN